MNPSAMKISSRSRFRAGAGVGEIDEVGETVVGRIGDLLDDRRAHVNGSA